MRRIEWERGVGAGVLAIQMAGARVRLNGGGARRLSNRSVFGCVRLYMTENARVHFDIRNRSEVVRMMGLVKLYRV